MGGWVVGCLVGWLVPRRFSKCLTVQVKNTQLLFKRFSFMTVLQGLPASCCMLKIQLIF